MRAYSSLEAFLSHLRVLRAGNLSRSNADFAGMERLLHALDEDERALLLNPPAPNEAGAAARHRARAENRLRRELLARGMLIA